MNKKLIATVTATIAVITAIPAQAASFEDNARVLSVQEQYDGGGQRRVCNQAPAQNNSNFEFGAGTVVGAVAGGLLGAQVGKGNGRVAASAVGAATGAVAGTAIQGRNNSNNQGEQNCYYENNGGRLVGYRVTYEYRGMTFTDMFRNPPMGDTVRVMVNLSPR